VSRAQGCWGGQLLVASAPRTGVYVICARNVRRTGRAGRSRAQVDSFADAIARGWAFFFSTPAPAPVQAPALFNAPNSSPSINFLRPGPRFCVYSPLEHYSFDT